MYYSENIKLDPRAQQFTLLKRDGARTAFIFVWDFFHWLSFDSQGKLDDIRFYGSAHTHTEALELAARELPGCKVVFRYCPRTAAWY